MTAPGEYVYTPFPGSRVGYWSGTSFAAPMVTGTIALAMGQNTFVGENQMAQHVTQGDDVSQLNLSYINQLGFGRLNIPTFLGRIGL